LEKSFPTFPIPIWTKIAISNIKGHNSRDILIHKKTATTRGHAESFCFDFFFQKGGRGRKKEDNLFGFHGSFGGKNRVTRPFFQ
jgi:hypothetical protein